jgi:serine/threonine-protein kinase
MAGDVLMFDHPAPMRLGNYEPLLELASGGMATVFVARQVGAGGFERLVVVKRVHPHLLVNKDFYDMFKDEGRVAAMLHHPNVVPVIDVVESGGELFLVMEYVESTSLATLMATTSAMGQRLPPPIVARVMHDTLSGLHAAHETVDIRGNRLEIVHRDFSPQNIVVGIDGSSRLIDFGVAKARHRLTETRSGSLKGKLGYMAPEQASSGALDRRADLFSAGIVLWEALTGKRLFRGENEFETIHRIKEQLIDPPSVYAPAVSAQLDAVVLRSLARDRDDRFQTAAAFLEALETAQPPAATRDVASILKAYCGERLEARRGTLLAMLEGRMDPLSAVSSSSAPGSRETVAASPDSRNRSKPNSRDARDEGTEGRISATRDATPARRLSPVGALAITLTAAVALVVLGVVVVLSARHREDNIPNVAARPTTSAAATGDVQLELVAPTAIAGVRATGLRSSLIAGTTAHLVIARWPADLPIEVELADGTTARVVALADGPRELAVVAVPAAVASAQPQATGSPSSSPPSPATAAPSPPVRPATPAAHGAPELHKSPYGP